VVENVQILHDSYASKKAPLLTAFVLEYYQAALLVPVIISDVVYGAIALFYNEPREFEWEAIQLAVSFADQTALAIENANLRVRAEQTAVAAERNRLARDLHDAVTQTLFSSSMIADVLPKIWERDPEMGKQRLAELRELTRGALAEMRTLLMELRPAALEDSNIKELFEQLTVSITGRARIPVELEITGDCELPVEVKVVFYRIAQEALNNIAKHSDGTSASVTFNCSHSKGELLIEDNGKGFDLNQATSGSLGFDIMQERAANINAKINIESQIGEGTCIQAIWQNEEVNDDRN
jgi:signal transduction histidine kinase